MKSIKQYLTGISLCAALFIAGGCSNENDMTGNGGGNGDGNPVPLTVRATTGSFEGVPETGKSNAPLSRTPIENGNTTTFSSGDAIGIFAVKEGAIVDNISNAKLTYDATTQNWKPDASTVLYYYEGVNYIAYYPYKNGITIDAAKTTDEIIASLADNSSLQPATDQSGTGGSLANYTASDLMIASGTSEADATDPAKKILPLNFKHQFSLLVLVPRVFVKCNAPANAGFVYRSQAKAPVVDTDANAVILNGITACKMSDGSYRAIVKPASGSSTLNGSYKNKDDRTINYEGNVYAAGFAAGSCYSLNVDSPLHGSGSTERALAPGDFVFHGSSNIEVYPGDGPLKDGKIPDYNDAVGMVVTCDQSRLTDAECNNKGWNHAYVMGLVNCGGKMNWGPVVDEDVLPNTMRDNGAENNMNGYTETEAMLAERASKGDLSNYGTFNAISTYRSGNAVPTGLNRSPWFVPSVGQWFDVMVNICGRSPKTFRNNTTYSWVDKSYGTEMWNAINSRLNKVDKPLTLVSSTEGGQIFFLCSSETGTYGWHSNWSSSGSKAVLGAIVKSDVRTMRVVRPFFAF